MVGGSLQGLGSHLNIAGHYDFKAQLAGIPLKEEGDGGNRQQKMGRNVVDTGRDLRKRVAARA